MDYKNKYLKYKNKYLNLKNIIGGVNNSHTTNYTQCSDNDNELHESIDGMKDVYYNTQNELGCIINVCQYCEKLIYKKSNETIWSTKTDCKIPRDFTAKNPTLNNLIRNKCKHLEETLHKLESNIYKYRNGPAITMNFNQIKNVKQLLSECRD